METNPGYLQLVAGPFTSKIQLTITNQLDSSQNEQIHMMRNWLCQQSMNGQACFTQVSNRILQIPHEQQAQALDEIDQVIAKYFILKPPRSAIQSSATDIIQLPESTTSKEALTSHLDPTQSIIGPSKPHIVSLSVESTNGTDDVPRTVKKKRKKTPSINILQVTSHPKADLTATETTELFAPQSLVRSSPPLPPLFSPSQTDPAPLAPLSPPLRFDSHCTSTYTSDLANALINPLHPCLVDYESEPPDDTEQFPSPNLSPTNSPIEISSTDNVPHIIGQTQAASPDSSNIEATVAPISPSCGNNDDGDRSFQVESLLPCLHSIQEQTQKVDNTPLSPLQPPTQVMLFHRYPHPSQVLVSHSHSFYVTL
ncbi:uncharacterized protein MELLADRAFT_86421 [Melampsora larici-populina 98AG31]|uniref:Uncharacterized protein n=1 Tax=Melampsora larici-populina (strain 98AG31 / pathotype 3-4-7) TaxID=747676 RepID=F4RLR5_MELLP|nr:uncharacterized protein MELLADRAFT_86421 [Melampsora larici-populina 98AG31]EGG06708.1 hypothetical protein MELLADRAFT_86421 [Melampsora larici-populina 98AG31]